MEQEHPVYSKYARIEKSAHIPQPKNLRSGITQRTVPFSATTQHACVLYPYGIPQLDRIRTASTHIVLFAIYMNTSSHNM
jgi:hypothetical protein